MRYHPFASFGWTSPTWRTCSVPEPYSPFYRRDVALRRWAQMVTVSVLQLWCMRAWVALAGRLQGVLVGVYT